MYFDFTAEAEVVSMDVLVKLRLGHPLCINDYRFRRISGCKCERPFFEIISIFNF